MKKQELLNIPVLCYPGHLAQTSKLSSTARIVLDALLILMDQENLICFDEQTINFLKQILAQHDRSFTIPTIKNTITELFKTELLLRAKNSHYIVNPQYFIKFDAGLHRTKKIEYLYSHGYYDKTINARKKE